MPNDLPCASILRFDQEEQKLCHSLLPKSPQGELIYPLPVEGSGDNCMDVLYGISLSILQLIITILTDSPENRTHFRDR
jgi:hypothetical protein